MKRLLIVNADDCNLTPGVTRAILDCHDYGILTSTTFMTNLPVEAKTVREILKRKNLGVGIHLNATLGKPVSSPALVRSLLEPSGNFKKLQSQTGKLPAARELRLEYQNQINRFRAVFGKCPTHLDTHHQVHDRPFFFKVLEEIALENKLPLRRSAILPQTKSRVKTTDYFFGNLTVEGYWRKEPLETILQNLPEGVSEVMCHPGKNDPALRAISSFTAGRAVEYALFRSPSLRKLVTRQGIALAHFGMCYNSQ